MIVVSNTSPIYYLWIIGHINLLELIFNTINIPQAVFSELTHKNCPSDLKM